MDSCSVSGVTCHLFDAYAAVRRCLSGTSYKPLLHVPCVSMSWATSPNDEVAGMNELARVAEAILLARTNPELRDRHR